MSWRHNLSGLVFNNWHVKVLSLIAAILIVYFNSINTLEERVLAVPLEARLSADYLPIEQIPASVRITLRGESDDIVNITNEDIAAFVDFSSFRSSGSHSAAVQVERKQNALTVDPLQITSEPTQISIDLAERAVREVEVRADVRGALAVGYELTQVSIDPSPVTISGPINALDNLTEVTTQRISILNHSSSSTTKAQLITPAPYVEFPNGDSVTVVFQINEVPITRRIEGVLATLVNVDSRFVTEYEIGTSFIMARGLPSELDALEQEVVLSADAAPISIAGQYRLPLIPQLVNPPESIEIIDYEPTTLLVTVALQPRGR